MKIPISTIREIIKKFQSTYKSPGRGSVSISSQWRVWISKDSPWITDGELQISWVLGSESLKIKINQQVHHHIARKILFAHPKTNSSIFSCQTRLEIQKGLDSMARWNKKKRAFWQQIHQMGLVQNGMKSTTHPRFNILVDR